VQEPSFRPVEFFTRVGAVFFQHPTRSIWTSWLDGMYATMWADAHSVLVPLANEPAFMLMGVLLVVAFLPTITIALGFAAALVDAVRGDDAAALLVLVSMWTWIALIWFALRIPGYSTIKAFYFLSLTPTLGLFLAQGRRLLDDGSRWARWTLDIALVVSAVLVLAIYTRPQIGTFSGREPTGVANASRHDPIAVGGHEVGSCATMRQNLDWLTPGS
jgi:hypothetical protein